MKPEPSPACSSSGGLFLCPSLKEMRWGASPVVPKVKSAQSPLLGVKNIMGNPGWGEKKCKKPPQIEGCEGNGCKMAARQQGCGWLLAGRGFTASRGGSLWRKIWESGNDTYVSLQEGVMGGCRALPTQALAPRMPRGDGGKQPSPRRQDCPLGQSLQRGKRRLGSAMSWAGAFQPALVQSHGLACEPWGRSRGGDGVGSVP